MNEIVYAKDMKFFFMLYPSSFTFLYSVPSVYGLFKLVRDK